MSVHSFNLSKVYRQTSDENMRFFKSFALVLVLACIAQMVLVAECEKKEEGRKRKKEGKEKPAQPEKQPSAPTDKSERGQKAQAGKVMKGKFPTKDKALCTWLATGGDVSTLSVNCGKGDASLACEYTAKPSACPQFASNPKSYWKQITRALKKQKNLCKDATALIKAGMCKKAPKDAHFKLSPSTSSQAEETLSKTKESRAKTTTGGPSATGKKNCPENTDQKKVAEEYCSETWSSLCNFFISMVQSEDC
nr:PREDICTED: fibroblast growth factor-binding protein 1 isoform X1 [Lepisosteus oculatus]